MCNANRVRVADTPFILLQGHHLRLHPPTEQCLVQPREVTYSTSVSPLAYMMAAMYASTIPGNYRQSNFKDDMHEK